MNYPGISNKTWKAQILWGVIVTAALIGIVLSAFQAALFSYDRLLTLAVAIFVSVLVSRFQSTITNTPIKFAAKNIFAFWGVLWLGVGGGVLLGASSSLTRLLAGGDENEDGPFTVAVDVVSTLAAAIIFYLVLGYLPYSPDSMAAVETEYWHLTITAIGLMAAIHYLFNSSLNYLLLRLDGSAGIRSLFVDQFVYPVPNVAVSLAATIILYFTFLKFGIEFGLVIVPLALFGDLAYKIHTGRLAQKTRQISDASRIHLATVEALATAIDARDQVGIGHVRRAQIYAIGIGETMGLSEGEISALRTGALLHDIGKLAVPDHILNKPGRLTPAEMEKTKIHSSVGASILEKVGFDNPVVPTVKYHHECWDGSGYPEGLKGNNIPLTARILSVADAYDTLRGARPYRPPVSREDACNFLMSGAGTQFDPKIVSVFLSNLRRFEALIDAQNLSYAFDPAADFLHLSAPDDSFEQGYVEQIKRANREVFTLYELARDFGSSVNLHETLSLFTRKIAEFVPFDTCSVYLLEESEDFAVASHVDGKSGPAFKGRRIKIGEGPTGEVLKKRQAIQNGIPMLDFSPSQQEFVQEYISMISLPLIADEKLVGAVTLYSSTLRSYEEEHMRLLETISRIAADAICKSQRHLVTETYALTDPMTGLPNARSLQMQFDREVARADRGGTSFQVLMLDLDGFKEVNDTFGHKMGDMMLKEIGRVIRGQLRDYDFLSRYAGDEFVALIPESQRDDVIDLCERIEKAVNDFVLPVSDSAFAKVGVSLGASSYPSHGASFDEIIVAADKGMYAEKTKRKRDIKRIAEDAKAGLLDNATIEVEAIMERELSHDAFVVELDETHIVSAAVN